MYFIGIDLGTSAMKLLLTNEAGRILNSCTREYPLSFPQPGWSEQEPAEWWAACLAGVTDLLTGFDASQVAGIGTGGTLSGAGKYLKEKNPDVKIIGVQSHPQSRPDSPDFSGHIIDGTLPLGRVPEQFVPTLILSNLDNGFAFDEIIDVKAEDAYQTARETAETDGLFLGTSAAAALTAAIEVAKRPEAEGKNIVVIYPDNGYKYLTTDLYKRNK